MTDEENLQQAKLLLKASIDIINYLLITYPELQEFCSFITVPKE